MTALVAGPVLPAALGHIVGRAADGDPNAFDRLTILFVDDAMRIAMAVLRSEADARDVVQDSFVAAWRELPRLRDRDAFEPWLTRIVVNRCRSALRHRRVVSVREIALERTDDERGRRPSIAERAATRGPGVSEAVADADSIRRAFLRLRPDDRVLLTLHHVEGRSVADVGRLLGAPEGTVKWRLHGARAALERALEVESR